MTKFKKLLVIFLGLIAVSLKIAAQNKPNNITVVFKNTINSIPIKLEDEKYTNNKEEIYSISKLKYYVSNIQLINSGQSFKEFNSYHLIDESDSLSMRFSFFAPQNAYTSISFLIGVDSLKNVSGAQTDALDPLNGMFWTWNTGYIMFKLEGQSLSSPIINNKIEYHIGGFKGPNNVLRKVELKFPFTKKRLNNITSTEIIIGMDIKNFWSVNKAFTIAKNPACTIPGAEAAKIATIYSKLFYLIKVITANL